MQLTDKLRKTFMGKSKGVGLVEVIVALAILGLVAAAFLNGLSTSLNAVVISDEGSTVLALAQGQMEYVKSLPYEEGASPSYEKTDEPSLDYPGYTVSIDAPPIDPDTGNPLANPDDDMGIQKITITIKIQSDEIFILEDYKVDL